MNFFSRWFGSGSKSSKARAPQRRARPSIEPLEARDVPTNDFFLVQGAANSQVNLTFKYDARSTPMWDELGVYTVTDDFGRVGGILPQDSTYPRQALNTARMAFEVGEIIGTETTLSFTAGTRLGFYLIRNQTLDNWETNNPNNLPDRDPQAFFSFDFANNDDLDHVRTQVFGDRSMKVMWENGDRLSDFNDDIITIRYTNPGAISTTGVEGQTIPVTFTFDSAGSDYRNEVGIFLVDDATGRIGTLSPGSTEWNRAALNSSMQVLFPRNTAPGATKTVDLPGGKFFGMFLITNGKVGQFLASNPANDPSGRIFAHFSFDAANTDDREHMRWDVGGKFSFEDSVGQPRDFDDFVGTVTFGTIANSAPTVRGSGTADITVPAGTTKRSIDLAGSFDDVDLKNSTVLVQTRAGDLKIELFDRTAPRTVANFFHYINSKAYKSSIFHRSARTNGNPFVLQGGGFKYVQKDAEPADLKKIGDSDDTVQNEFGVSNTRGTLAMAKVGNDPNSATSQFFFNLSNNASNLDSQNGGFTVFGTVLDDGMKIIDQLAHIPIVPQTAFDSSLDELPMKNYTGNDFPHDTKPGNFAFLNKFTVLNRPEFLTYEIVTIEQSNSNPIIDVANTKIVDNRIKARFVANATGTATITVRATDTAGNSVTDTFDIRIP